MRICAIKIKLDTPEGLFGFETTFSEHLNIIRGNNSSGKSTIYNSIIYCLGMEEIIGSKGPKSLPYALKEHFNYNGREIKIESSKVMLEIKNHEGKTVTISRVIIDKLKSNKLIEIIDGPILTQKLTPTEVRPTYVHDSGGATKEEGFHFFLEKFLNYNLPTVPLSNSTAQTKLYLQTIFAALIIEQKRGWSDYLANIPYYGIRDVKTHVAEFLLNLNVFENNILLDTLNKESIKLHQEWEFKLRQIERISSENSLFISNLPTKLVSDFERDKLSINKKTFTQSIKLDAYIKELQAEGATLEHPETSKTSSDTEQQLGKLDELTADIEKLSNSYELLISRENLSISSLKEYENFILEIKEDLERNKAAFKLKSLGAELNIRTASDFCPTCSSPISDSLAQQLTKANEMSLEENINYLNKQAEMISRQIRGLRSELKDIESIKSDLSKRIDEKRRLLSTIKKAVILGEGNVKAIYMRQIQVEDELKKLDSAALEIETTIESMSNLSKDFFNNKKARKGLPENLLSDEDSKKINVFQSFFRANASAFGYSSADINLVEINKGSLTPYLFSTELREMADIKSDSSASDFVRLIWSYLIALYQTSTFSLNQKTFIGNHPKFILFDEPGQHSMGEESQRALFNLLGSEKGLQSIVAASFDESDAVFNEATHGVKFNLISLDIKCIKPLQS